MKTLKMNPMVGPLAVFAVTLVFLLFIGVSGWETRDQTPKAIRLSLKRSVEAKFKGIHLTMVGNPLVGQNTPYPQNSVWNEQASEIWEAVWLNDSLILSAFPPLGIEQNKYPHVFPEIEQRPGFTAYKHKEIFSCQVVFSDGQEIEVSPQDYSTWLSKIEQPAKILYWHGKYIADITNGLLFLELLNKARKVP